MDKAPGHSIQVQQFVFHRPALAMQFADLLEGKIPLSDVSSGLFLSAPRRTGKSTFLKGDLIPELGRRGLICVYVDLWRDITRDPADLIAEAIAGAIDDRRGAISKMAQGGLARVTGRRPVNKVGIASATVDLGPEKAVSIAARLKELAGKNGRIVLLIDEAQHATTTPRGFQNMVALKAARDEFNIATEHPRLLLVFTGSNRHKLSELYRTRKDPFFGVLPHQFPLLERDFVDALVAHYNKNRLAKGSRLDAAVVWKAFLECERRPEHLRSVLKDAVEAQGPESIDERVLALADEVRNAAEMDLESTFRQMTSVQQAIILRMIAMGESYTPYDKASLAAYSRHAGRDVPLPSAQSAIEALAGDDRGIVWRSSHGDWMLEEPEAWARWSAARQANVG